MAYLHVLYELQLEIIYIPVSKRPMEGRVVIGSRDFEKAIQLANQPIEITGQTAAGIRIAKPKIEIQNRGFEKPIRLSSEP